MRPSTILALTVFVVCLFGYHYIYFWFTERQGVYTKKGRINDCIASWIKNALDDGDYLLVVHQVRNIVMAITFLATTAVLLMGFMIGFAEVGRVIDGPSSGLSIENYPAWTVVATLGFSLLSFLLSLRYLTQVTFLIRSSPEKLGAIEDTSPEEYLKKLFVIGSREYTMGRRSMLYAIVALSWFIDVWIFIVLTLLMTFMFIYLHDF